MDISNYNELSPVEATAYQRELRNRLQIMPLDKPIKVIAGADISFNKFSDTIYAGIVVLSYPELQVLEKQTLVSKTSFPYIPGLLAFREIPALTEVWNKLTIKPDVLVCDGHGIAHPRRMGIATHFGIVVNTPTIGCGKSRLTGKYEEPGTAPFSESFLKDKNEIIGIVLKTKKNCKPVFVSPGNLISLEQSVELIKQCVGKYRIPEPTRLAHLLVNEVRVNAMQQNR